MQIQKQRSNDGAILRSFKMGGDELDMKAYELINHKAHVLQTVLMIDPPLASPQCARDCAGLWIPLTFHSLDLYSISNRLHVLSSSSLPTIQLSSLLRKNRHGVPFPIPIQASFEGLSEQLVKSSTVNCFQAGKLADCHCHNSLAHTLSFSLHKSTFHWNRFFWFRCQFVWFGGGLWHSLELCQAWCIWSRAAWSVDQLSLLRKNRHGVLFPIPIEARGSSGLSEQLVKSSTVHCFQAGKLADWHGPIHPPTRQVFKTQMSTSKLLLGVHCAWCATEPARILASDLWRSSHSKEVFGLNEERLILVTAPK